MKNQFKFHVLAAMLIAVGSLSSHAQQAKRTPFDVTNYVIDAVLSPTENKLAATTDVTFVPLEDTRTVTFELNGSLRVDTITRIDSVSAAAAAPAQADARGRAPARPTPTPAMESAGGITFVQDQAGVSDLGPSVRVDLGENVAKGTPVTLRFKYSGVLNSPNGGPLITKRLAYVGDQRGYLMYAARWFPFHDYAADLATADVSLTVPGGFQVVGFSDTPVTNAGGKFRFSIAKPGLVGNFAYGRFAKKDLNFGGYNLEFYTQPGMEGQTARFAETLGKALEYYTKRWGEPDAGKKLIVIQTDDDTLDFYSARGMLYVANRHYEEAREITLERLQREAAFQWWGLTVGLRSFDDAWLSQGLAEYSAFSLREQALDGAKLEALRRELLEKSLTFEQTASLLRAPSTLDDTSTAYQYIMYAKGALVYKLLRDTLGEQKFDQLLRTFLQRYRGKNASIDDFEKLASEIAGQPMRYFFARWVESTGVPEFTADYQIIRTRSGKFVTRGTVKQNYDNLRLPVDVQLRSEGEQGLKTVTVQMDEASADFNIESTGKPLAVVIDPEYKLLRISPDLRVSSIARRGIEQFKEGNYVDAQQQFEAALKLDRSNAWVYYHLGLLFLEQRNYDLAIENFKAARDLGAQGVARPAWLHVWSEIKMGNAYDAKGDRTRATAAYNRAQALGDNYDNAQEAVKKYQATPYDPKERQATASK
ncbi:MAG: M1 family aminopeptidase [Pyrinomonadaceae bacterium]